MKCFFRKVKETFETVGYAVTVLTLMLIASLIMCLYLSYPHRDYYPVLCSCGANKQHEKSLLSGSVENQDYSNNGQEFLLLLNLVCAKLNREGKYTES